MLGTTLDASRAVTLDLASCQNNRGVFRDYAKPSSKYNLIYL